MAPATGQKVVTLRDAKVAAGSLDASAKILKTKVDGLGEIVVALGDQGYASFNQIDLTGIKNIQVSAFVLAGQTVGGKLELHLGSPTGKLVSSVDIQKRIIVNIRFILLIKRQIIPVFGPKNTFVNAKFIACNGLT